jgi:hypothetical protein
MKTRYNKPFEQVEIKIPWDSGMDKYSGLIEFFEHKRLLVKDGNSLRYDDLSGHAHKYFRKRIPDELLDLIMNEFHQQMEKKSRNENENIEPIETDSVTENAIQETASFD